MTPITVFLQEKELRDLKRINAMLENIKAVHDDFESVAKYFELRDRMQSTALVAVLSSIDNQIPLEVAHG